MFTFILWSKIEKKIVQLTKSTLSILETLYPKAKVLEFFWSRLIYSSAQKCLPKKKNSQEIYINMGLIISSLCNHKIVGKKVSQ